MYFQEPRRYTAWIRFLLQGMLNGLTQADVRGMAIKLTGVKGEKLLAGKRNSGFRDDQSPDFFIRNVQDYVDLFNAVQEAKGKPPLKFFFRTQSLQMAFYMSL